MTVLLAQIVTNASTHLAAHLGRGAVDDGLARIRPIRYLRGSLIGGSMKLATTIAATTLLLSAAACSGDPEVLEPDPTASTTLTATPPPLPDAAKEPTPSGAANYVQHWVDVFNFSAMTGETDSLRKLSTSCKACLAYADDFSGLDPSERASTGPWVIQDISVSEESDPIVATAQVLVDSSGGETQHELDFILKKGDPFQLVDIAEIK